jgi:hypothetical protein
MFINLFAWSSAFLLISIRDWPGDLNRSIVPLCYAPLVAQVPAMGMTCGDIVVSLINRIQSAARAM